MDGAGANMCKAVNIEGVAVKATFVSRVCVGGKELDFVIYRIRFQMKESFLVSESSLIDLDLQSRRGC